MEVPQIVEYPKKVDSQNILHLIMFGPSKSGKTQIASYVKNLQKRALIKFDEIIDKNIQQSTEDSEAIKKFLQ